MAKRLLDSRIKEDIRADKLPVDTWLTQAWLSEFYQVSRIPVRDAIAKLLKDGWPVGEGKKGVKVPPLNAQQAEELYLMRLPLETLALELAFEQLNFACLGKARDVLTQLAEGDQLSALEQGVLNWQFHCCLYQPCNKPLLLKTLNQLHEQCERYIGFQTAKLDYHQQSEKEHYQLLEALENWQLDQAIEILSEHIKVAGQRLMVNLTDFT